MIAFEGKFRFGTKAETLERLGPLLKESIVPHLLSFPVGRWHGGAMKEICETVGGTFAGSKVVVRSSALGEDGDLAAQAGAFLSVPGIDPEDRQAVQESVDAVIASYAKFDVGNGKAPENQVIVQHMVEDVLVSGVLFTQELNTGAPYYVINYDDETGSTDTITAGKGYTNRTLYVFRDEWPSLTSPRFLKILAAVREIEDLVGDSCLDIEFALDREMTVHILQVRRITTKPNWNRGLTLKIQDALRRVKEGISERYLRNSEAGADRLGGTVLGTMPDWNPAEMIGTTPRPLAFSLYRYLITDRVWRVARRLMGYRENRGMPLMMSLAGQPYIDVGESFRSYLPAELDDAIGEKLVLAWLERLRENHHLHDKVEFDVAVTAYSADFDMRVDEQFPDALSRPERETFRKELRHLTNNLLSGRVASIDGELSRLGELSSRRSQVVSAATTASFETVSVLLEDAIEYGTIPFSILARHGFVAVSALRGLERRGVISSTEAAAFQQSVPTIATDFLNDIHRYSKGDVDEEYLKNRYGYLRPGTYDILSLRYDQRLSDFSNLATDFEPPPHTDSFTLPKPTLREIDALLKSEGIEIDAKALFAYCRNAIQAREYAKFVFTHNVSDALEFIATLGERFGLSREELSYIDIRDFFDSFVELRGRSVESHLRELSQRGRDAHAVTNAIRLPFLVTSLSDLVIVPLAVEHPNYVTRKNIRGEVALLDSANLDPAIIDGKIVAIESADPGFDWIFTRPILGLVTRFGGVNSHMAIRCAEFGLPAAIGCGEQIFERIVRANVVDLNCADGRIIVG